MRWALPPIILICFTGCTSVESRDSIHHSLLGDQTFPEGIAAHVGDDTLFVGGLASGDIQRITAAGATYFKQPHEDGLLNVIGLAVDPERDRLWAASSSFFDPMTPPTLFVFDTSTGTRLASFGPPPDDLPHFFNDIAIDTRGNAYVTDSMTPIVWKVDGDLRGLDAFASDPAFVVDPMGFNLNGIAITPDDEYAVVSVPTVTGHSGKLFRIDLDDGAVHAIPVPDDFGGVDGLAVLDNTTIFGTGGVPGVTRLEFDDSFASVKLVPIPALEDQLDLPTTAAVLGDRLWIVNSQLDHFVPLFPDFGKPHESPFDIVGIAVEQLTE